MKAIKQRKRLERKQSAFHSDRTIQDALSRNPGSYHKPGSLKKT